MTADAALAKAPLAAAIGRPGSAVSALMASSSPVTLAEANHAESAANAALAEAPLAAAAGRPGAAVSASMASSPRAALVPTLYTFVDGTTWDDGSLWVDI